MLRRFIIVVFTLVLANLTMAQVPAKPERALPDAPSPSTAVREKNELLASDPYVPLTAKQKANEWLHRTYSPSTFVAAGVDTTFAAMTATMRYCCGGDAWGKQYGASLADAESRYLFGKFLFPTLLKQDPRYLPKRQGSVMSRAWYAATRVLITRNDKGANVFNSSEFLAIASSKALTNTYYPDRDRTWERTVNSFLGTLQGDASGFLLTEFTPDIKRIFRRHTPKPLLELSDRVTRPRGIRRF